MLSQSTNTPVRNSTGKEQFIDFSGQSSTHLEGRLFYDTEDHSLAYYNENANITANICREELVRVHNGTGADIADGTMVYINATPTLGWPGVSLAKADTFLTAHSTLGMTTCPIPNGQYGYVCTSGVVHGLDTHTFADGSSVYLSETTAGAITATPPLQPNYVVEIGTVVYSASVDGRIYIKIDKKPWYPTIELRDTSASIVLPTTPTLFKPSSMTTVRTDGFTYDTANGVIHINTSSSYAISHLFNAEPSAANKNIYFYAEESYDGGSTWTISRYSARQLQLPNAQPTQVVIPAARYYPVNTALRYYIWGDATVTLKSIDLPGTTAGTVTLAAYRCMMA